MIIIGYQGIGKSTLARTNPNIIDLESRCFWFNNQRPEDWYIYYCQTAEHLSKQGYDVFVSSHKSVREFLIDNCNEPVAAIVPAVSLKDDWILKLQKRFSLSQSEKDKKAYLNAKEVYEENIMSIIDDIENYYIITKMDYSLNKALEILHTSFDR